MSMYVTIKTQFKNKECLVSALMETGNWTKEQVEVHEEARNLYGYHGDIREDKAHIIIRRQHVGGASNDIGFVKGEDGSYSAIISQYDSMKHNAKWIGTLKYNYGYHVTRQQAKTRGLRVERQVLPNGNRAVVVTGYR